MISARGQRGFTLTELLIAAGIVAAALIPLLISLQSAYSGTRANAAQITERLALLGRVETVLAEDFDDLLTAAETAFDPTVPTSYSDAPGSSPRVLVYLSFYDVENTDADNDPFTIFDPNTDADNNPYTSDPGPGAVKIKLLWLRAEVEGTTLALETLTRL